MVEQVGRGGGEVKLSGGREISKETSHEPKPKFPTYYKILYELTGSFKSRNLVQILKTRGWVVTYSSSYEEI